MKGRLWPPNRVYLGMAVILVLLGFWEFSWKPQYRDYYKRGMKEYQAGNFTGALPLLAHAYKISPNALEVITMMGWTHLRLHQYEQARFHFTRALNIDPSDDEAELGLLAIAASQELPIDAAKLQKIRDKRPKDPDVLMMMASVYAQTGNHLAAAELYRGLVNDKGYAQMAQEALQQIFGLQGFNDPVPTSLPALEKSPTLQVRFRATDRSMWRLTDHGWEKYYVAGVNLGPGSPGHSPGDPPLDGKLYSDWLRDMEQMNANVVRAYTLLPTAFYRAFRHNIEAGSHLLLFQQIWISVPPDNNLYDPKFVEDSKSEIRYMVDALHGHADVPRKNARGSGIYVNDVSGQVAAILLGREIEPSIAQQTNASNPNKTSYTGNYIAIADATATETWFAELLDYLVRYETETYNWQHPVALVNWPPLDPLYHPTEATLADRVKRRIADGEDLKPVTGFNDDDDVVSIDEAKFKVMPAFQAGLFASYHVYPYYPDFLIYDPQYLKTRDKAGPNPMLGYLRELRARIPYPLVISEYGVPNSKGIAHLHPYGWNHGGHTEDEQAHLLSRLTHTIRDSGCAGGIVFEYLDEWYKQNWINRDFEEPAARANLWINELDPEKRYGLVGFHPSKWKLFAGDAAAWKQEKYVAAEVASAPASPSQELVPKLQAAADEAFLYLRLENVCRQCLDSGNRTYAVAISTAPNLGIKRLPLGGIQLQQGANFLLLVGNAKSSRLLIADSYYPYQAYAGFGAEYLANRKSFTPSLQENGEFHDMVVEVNPRRMARDGKIFAAQRYNHSLLRLGSGNPDSPDFDSLSDWYEDTGSGAILVRIPWGKLLVTDPSSHRVFGGFNGSAQAQAIATPGIGFALFVLGKNKDTELKSMPVLASIPVAQNGTIPKTEVLTWQAWNQVSPEAYFKKSYYALQKEFHTQISGSSLAGHGDGHHPGNRHHQPSSTGR